ncbi:LysR family transcriptional regulator [Flexibacterium corallicola]|uniref:LysR family transcriptional regulator n=1 Tax=Flexibacterium corallicola TaxID=3037259 RepID=UPI00286F06FF|nr:LysR family transcriptional regulator [Pseudovibrio sp. M1P-2-3]
MVDWNGINEFVAVTETGSFTGAAKQLGLSTAHISRQVSELENRLAVRLFYRTTRSVTITEHGQMFYGRCRQIQEDLCEAERQIAGLQSAPRGRFKLTAPTIYGQDRIAPLINDFLTLHPELEVHFNLTNETVDLIEEGYDLAIRLGQLKASSMIARKLTSRTLHVCACPAYIERHGAPEALTDLGKHNCLVGSLSFWRFREHNKAKTVKVRGSLHCNSGWALLDGALKGIGLTQLPDYYVEEHLESGRLVSVLNKYRETEEGVWALYPHSRKLSPNVKFLIDFLKDKL